MPTQYRIEVADEPPHWKVVASSEDRGPYDAKPQEFKPLERLSKEDKAEYDNLNKQSEELNKKISAFSEKRIYAGVFRQPDTIFRLHRGEVMQRREPIDPGTPVYFGNQVQLPATASDADRRAALARWLGDPRHPLTSRVMVNRIWQFHFGRGLAGTPNDFGFNGGIPSHPELLDWLAGEFVAHDGRPKYLHRMILLSSVYRQASTANPQAAAIDADSQLLWRFRPTRLEAEPIHDAILSAAGVLDLAGGGPGYDVFEANTSYVKVYKPKMVFTPADFRRMAYQNKPRMQRDPTFGVFDCPDASQSVAKRNISTTALQSLNLLNSPFMMQQAGLFAERLAREFPEDSAGQVRRAFKLVFAREPDAEELSGAQRLIADAGLPQFCRALFNANEFVFVR